MIEQVRLARIESSSQCMIGRLHVGDLPPIYTLEPPWRNNERGRSCIIAGEYLCELRRSPRFGMRYWVKDVPGRSWILVHSGNVARHTLGCILPGMRRGYLKGQRAVLSSKPAVRVIEQYFAGRPFCLVIEDFIGPPQLIS